MHLTATYVYHSIIFIAPATRQWYDKVYKTGEVSMSLLGPLGNAGARRRGRRRGLVVGAAVGSSMANKKAAAAAQQAQANAAPQTDDTVNQLKQLAELRDQGILTDEEFEAKKKQILGL